MRRLSVNDVKNIFIIIIIFIVWSFGMFGFGYLLSNRRATEQLNEANKQLEAEQQRYDNLIRETEDRIRNIRTELLGKVSNNGETAKELTSIIEQIKRQRIDI